MSSMLGVDIDIIHLFIYLFILPETSFDELHRSYELDLFWTQGI